MAEAVTEASAFRFACHAFTGRDTKDLQAWPLFSIVYQVGGVAADPGTAVLLRDIVTSDASGSHSDDVYGLIHDICQRGRFPVVPDRCIIQNV